MSGRWCDATTWPVVLDPSLRLLSDAELSFRLYSEQKALGMTAMAWFFSPLRDGLKSVAE